MSAFVSLSVTEGDWGSNGL